MSKPKAEGIAREKNACFLTRVSGIKRNYSIDSRAGCLTSETGELLKAEHRPDPQMMPIAGTRGFAADYLCKTFTQLNLSVMYLNQSGSRS
jgi:hypothetical protein